MKDPKPFLRHILHSIEMIENYIAGKTFQDFADDSEMQDAVMRRLEIIGEATRNVPESVVKEHKNVEWKYAIGLRNVIAHQYFSVDLRVIWDTVKINIPQLKKGISEVLKDMEGKESTE